MIETGAKKLAQLFTKTVASGSSGNPPAGSDFQFSPFPRDALASLQLLVKFLRALPLPATHPSHPAATAILSTLKEAQRGYAEMRGNWGRKCLELYGRRVVDRAETTDGVSAGREFGQWTSNLLEVIEASLLTGYCCVVPPDFPTGGVQSSYSAGPAPRPIPPPFYLSYTSHTSNYPLQHHIIISLHSH